MSSRGYLKSVPIETKSQLFGKFNYISYHQTKKCIIQGKVFVSLVSTTTPHQRLKDNYLYTFIEQFAGITMYISILLLHCGIIEVTVLVRALTCVINDSR